MKRHLLLGAAIGGLVGAAAAYHIEHKRRRALLDGYPVPRPKVPLIQGTAGGLLGSGTIICIFNQIGKL